MSFSYNDFIVEGVLPKVLNNCEDIKLKELKSVFSYNGENLNLDGFNLIHGMNISDKTMMLREISKLYNVHIFNMSTTKCYFDKLD